MAERQIRSSPFSTGYSLAFARFGDTTKGISLQIVMAVGGSVGKKMEDGCAGFTCPAFLLS